jgi:ABC-2 type transport system permease protein
MKVFNLFFKIARAKAFILLLYIGIFLAICFPLVNSSKEKLDFEEASITVCVIDEDQTETSRALMDVIAERNNLIQLPNDRQKIMDAMFYEVVDDTIVIRKGFEERLSDPSDSSDEPLFYEHKMRDTFQSAMTEQFLNNFIRFVKVYVAGGDPVFEAAGKAGVELTKEAEVEIVTPPGKEVLDENFTENFALYFRFLPYLLVAMMVNVLSTILTSLNRKDQKARIECSSVKMSSYMGQIFLGAAVFTVLIWLIFMVCGMLVYGGVYRGLHCSLAVLNSFLFAIIASLIAILISSFNPSGTVVNMIAQVLGLGMAFICGAFVPQTMLGEGVMAVARIFPVYWFEKANDMLAGIQKGTLGDVRMCFIVEGIYIAALVIVIMLLSARRGGLLRHKAAS